MVVAENRKLRAATDAYEQNDAALRAALVAKDSAQVLTERRVYFEQVLRKDALAQANAYKFKARKRGVVNVLLALALGFVTYTAISR